MTILLTLKDLILNIVTFGLWERIQGAKSSRVTNVKYHK